MEVNWQKAAILGGLAAAGVAAVAYLLQPAEEEETPTPPPKQKTQKSSVSSASAQPASRTEELKKSVSEPKLNKEGVIRLFSRVRDRLSEKIKELRHEFLTERRKHFNQDKQAYKQSILNFLEGQQKLNETAFVEVLEQEGVTNADLENAMRKFGNDSQVLNAMGKLREGNTTLPAVPDSLTIEKLEEVFEFQIQKLQEHKGTGSERFDLIQAQSEVSDSIFEMFGYEDEEILAAISKYRSDIPRLGEYMRSIEKATHEVLASS